MSQFQKLFDTHRFALLCKQRFIDNSWKTIHYSDYCTFGLWYRRDYLAFIASRKRLPVSVAVQIILPAKSQIAGFRHKPAKFSNHTILCHRRIFRPEEGGTWNKRLRVPGVIHFISVFPLTGKGLPHWNALTEDADCLYHWGRHQFVLCDIQAVSTASASIPHSLV